MLFNFKVVVLMVSMLCFTISCSDAIKSVDKQENRLSTDLVKNNQSLNNQKSNSGQPIMEVLNEEFDFGEIREGKNVIYEYKIKNIGTADLLISAAKGSCGCTVPEWPKEPIKIGEEATIKVTFNSRGKKGVQNKRVTLTTNAIPNVKILTIKGTVIPKNKDK
jgi:hypothetical protein